MQFFKSKLNKFFQIKTYIHNNKHRCFVCVLFSKENAVFFLKPIDKVAFSLILCWKLCFSAIFWWNTFFNVILRLKIIFFKNFFCLKSYIFSLAIICWMTRFPHDTLQKVEFLSWSFAETHIPPPPLSFAKFGIIWWNLHFNWKSLTKLAGFSMSLCDKIYFSSTISHEHLWYFSTIFIYVWIFRLMNDFS